VFEMSNTFSIDESHMKPLDRSKTRSKPWFIECTRRAQCLTMYGNLPYTFSRSGGARCRQHKKAGNSRG
jgi:hypothetical protein